MGKGGHLSIDVFKTVPVARIPEAYFSNLNDQSAKKTCADGLWRTATDKFNSAQKNNPAARNDLSMIFHLLELISEKNHLKFILAYVVCIYNKVVTLQKSYKKIYAKLLQLYSPGANAPKLDVQKDIIRTYADILYTEKDYQGAGKKYMEFFCAHSPSFHINTGDFRIFDDTLLHRLRICLTHSGYLTLALLTCQLMKTGRNSEYQKAMRMLRNNETRDAGANCSEFIFDTAIIEMLSSHYQACRMTKSLNTLFAGGSSLATKKTSPAQWHRRRSTDGHKSSTLHWRRSSSKGPTSPSLVFTFKSSIFILELPILKYKVFM